VTAPAEAGGLIGPHLQAFFAEHLLAHKRASPQAIACYRDTFRLLPRFMRDSTGTALRVPDSLGQVTRVMATPVKRCDKRLVGYLSRDEVKALLAAPARTAGSARPGAAADLLQQRHTRLGGHRAAARAGAAQTRCRPSP